MEIPEDKLYRIVKLKNGQYQGEYRIYWNKYIWSLFEHTDIYEWGNKECLQAQAGDWIETYDGTILPLLRMRIHKDKKKRTFHFFYFPVATVYSWTNWENKTQFRQLQGNFMYGTKNQIGMKTIAGSNNQKLRFVHYIIAGLNPLKAYRIAFNNKSTLPVTTLHRKVNQLMSDEIVKKEIFNQIQPLVEKLGEQFSDERLINELDELLERSRKGSDAHRENIKFIMALLNKLPSAMYPGKNSAKDRAIEAQYSEVAPPMLGEMKKEEV